MRHVVVILIEERGPGWSVYHEYFVEGFYNTAEEAMERVEYMNERTTMIKNTFGHYCDYAGMVSDGQEDVMLVVNVNGEYMGTSVFSNQWKNVVDVRNESEDAGDVELMDKIDSAIETTGFEEDIYYNRATDDYGYVLPLSKKFNEDDYDY